MAADVMILAALLNFHCKFRRAWDSATSRQDLISFLAPLLSQHVNMHITIIACTTPYTISYYGIYVPRVYVFFYKYNTLQRQPIIHFRVTVCLPRPIGTQTHLAPIGHPPLYTHTPSLYAHMPSPVCTCAIPCVHMCPLPTGQGHHCTRVPTPVQLWPRYANVLPPPRRA